MMDPGLMITDYEQLRAMEERERMGDGSEGIMNKSNISSSHASSSDPHSRSERTPLSRSMGTVEILSRVVAGESTITRFQICGHTFLFAGSVFFLWTSVWDLATVAEDDDDDAADDDDAILPFLDKYDLVSFLGPFLYLLFGIAELFVAAKRTQDARIQRENDDESYSTDESRTTFFTADADHWEVAIGLSMCLAAFFDLMSTLQPMMNEEISDQFPDPGVLAVHFFLLEAILALWAREVYSRLIVVQRLGTCADVFFLLGCIIDVIVSYLPDPGEADDDVTNQGLLPQWILADWGSVVSSSLWLLNSIMYLFADLMNIQDDCFSVSLDDESLSNSVLPSDLSVVYHDARALGDQRDLSEPLLPPTDRTRRSREDGEQEPTASDDNYSENR